ncbi:MAG TPA: YjbQ family protein [Dehalococcoidia bacterium]|nr:YjbQ family protein [Dehalococcoidia bacterium]
MIVTKKISLSTRGECDIIDITPQVAEQVSQSGIDSGVVTIFVAGSTAGVTTIEFEPGLISDLEGMWQRIAPKGIPYDHDRRWGDGNGYAHVRASLLGASLVVPVSSKKLTLGTWQQIVLVDFDNRPRSREVNLQIMGD